jgi:DNA invertase Pin-like site-specific DNA recombinase
MSLAVEYARKHGLILDETLTFQDLGISAYRGANAETGQLGALLEAISVGLIPKNSLILVENLDRISRQTARKALRLIESIVEMGVTVVTLIDERQYTLDNLDNDPINLLLAILTFIRANEESQLKSKRIAAAWIAKRANALNVPMTSAAPGWLRLDRERGVFEILPENARIIQRIFAEAQKGYGSMGISRMLNIEKIRYSNSNPKRSSYMWYSANISKILKNPAVIGTLIPYRYEQIDGRRVRVPLTPVPNYFPAIIKAEQFEKIQAQRQCTKPNQSNAAYNMIGRLGRCSLCGSSTTLASKSERGHYLVCRAAHGRLSCTAISVRYKEIEGALIEHFSKIIYHLISNASETVKKRLDNLKMLIRDPVLNRPALNAALLVLLDSVVVYQLQGKLRLNWKHCDATVVNSAFTVRHLSIAKPNKIIPSKPCARHSSKTKPNRGSDER